MLRRLGFAACVGILACANAFAEKIVVERFTFPIESARAGEYTAAGDDGPFPAWCAEKEQFLRFGESIEYEQIDGVTAWGTEKAYALDRLMSWAALNGEPSDSPQSAAIQQAIWGILEGGAGVFDTSGVPITLHVYQLHNLDKQDLLVTVPLDEPEPLPLALIGLLLLSLARTGSRRA